MKKKLKCFVCHKEINEEDDYVFLGKTVHKGECLKSMIDEYNAVRNLQIRNKRLCVEIERLNKELQDTKEHLGEYLHEQEEENNRLNNIINELEKLCIDNLIYDELGMKVLDQPFILDKIKELKGSD